MKIVVLDDYAENPGDLYWEGLKLLSDEKVLYDRIPSVLIFEKPQELEVAYANKTPLTVKHWLD